MNPAIQKVFLFPLAHVSLFPSTTKPLNIFEPRYIAMIRDSVKFGIPIALATIDNPFVKTEPENAEDINFVRPLAGFGHVDIIEERGNGALLVFLKGEGKIKLTARTLSEQDYLQAEGEVITEDNSITEDNKNGLYFLRRSLQRWVQRHIPDVQQQTLFMQNIFHPQEIISAVSTYLLTDYDIQYLVFEQDSMNRKISLLYRLLQTTQAVLD